MAKWHRMFLKSGKMKANSSNTSIIADAHLQHMHNLSVEFQQSVLKTVREVDYTKLGLYLINLQQEKILKFGK